MKVKVKGDSKLKKKIWILVVTALCVALGMTSSPLTQPVLGEDGYAGDHNTINQLLDNAHVTGDMRIDLIEDGIYNIASTVGYDNWDNVEMHWNGAVWEINGGRLYAHSEENVSLYDPHFVVNVVPADGCIYSWCCDGFDIYDGFAEDFTGEAPRFLYATGTDDLTIEDTHTLGCRFIYATGDDITIKHSSARDVLTEIVSFIVDIGGGERLKLFDFVVENCPNVYGGVRNKSQDYEVTKLRINGTDHSGYATGGDAYGINIDLEITDTCNGIAQQGENNTVYIRPVVHDVRAVGIFFADEASNNNKIFRPQIWNCNGNAMYLWGNNNRVIGGVSRDCCLNPSEDPIYQSGTVMRGHDNLVMYHRSHNQPEYDFWCGYSIDGRYVYNPGATYGGNIEDDTIIERPIRARGSRRLGR